MTNLRSIGGRDVPDFGDIFGKLRGPIAAALLLLLFLFVIIIIGGGFIYALISSRTIPIPEPTTTSTSTSTTTIQTTTSTLAPTTTSTTTTTTYQTTTSTSESTTTTLSTYQIAFCIARKVDVLYMRNNTVCSPCKSIRNFFSDSVDLINIVDCDENKEQCQNEINGYIEEGLARRSNGAKFTGSASYPTALIDGTAYVGVGPSSLQDLTGCH